MRRLLKNVSRSLRRKIARERIDDFVSSHATAALTLDLGCGGPRYGALYPNRVGVDIVPSAGLHVIADGHHLPMGTHIFPVVLCSEMLEHTQNPQQVVDEIRRVLAPGGKLILGTRFVFPIHEAPNDFYRFSNYALQRLFGEWPAVEIEPDTAPMETLGSLLQRLAYQCDFRGGRLTRLSLLMLARIFARLDFLIIRQFGDYARSIAVDNIMASGYFVTASTPELSGQAQPVRDD